MGEDTTSGPAPELTLEGHTNALRSELKDTGRKLLTLKQRVIANPATDDKELNGEAIANIVLSFRHVEDAAMRLGKVLQALNGGESIYGNSGVVGQKVV